MVCYFLPAALRDVFTIFQTFLKAETIVTMPERFYHYFQRKGSIMNKDGLLALDMDIVLEMRAAFEYQEREVRKAYPSEKFSNRYNYYTTDMLIIYTMIMFVKRKDAVRGFLSKTKFGRPAFVLSIDIPAMGFYSTYEIRKISSHSIGRSMNYIVVM